MTPCHLRGIKKKKRNRRAYIPTQMDPKTEKTGFMVAKGERDGEGSIRRLRSTYVNCCIENWASRRHSW